MVKSLNKELKLFTQKHSDFKFLEEISVVMVNKEHLTPEGLRKIVAIKASMNLGLSEKLKSAFPDVVPVPRPIVEPSKTIDPH